MGSKYIAQPGWVVLKHAKKAVDKNEVFHVQKDAGKESAVTAEVVSVSSESRFEEGSFVLYDKKKGTLSDDGDEYVGAVREEDIIAVVTQE